MTVKPEKLFQPARLFFCVREGIFSGRHSSFSEKEFIGAHFPQNKKYIFMEFRQSINLELCFTGILNIIPQNNWYMRTIKFTSLERKKLIKLLIPVNHYLL